MAGAENLGRVSAVFGSIGARNICNTIISFKQYSGIVVGSFLAIRVSRPAVRVVQDASAASHIVAWFEGPGMFEWPYQIR